MAARVTNPGAIILTYHDLPYQVQGELRGGLTSALAPRMPVITDDVLVV